MKGSMIHLCRTDGVLNVVCLKSHVTDPYNVKMMPCTNKNIRQTTSTSLSLMGGGKESNPALTKQQRGQQHHPVCWTKLISTDECQVM